MVGQAPSGDCVTPGQGAVCANVVAAPPQNQQDIAENILGRADIRPPAHVALERNIDGLDDVLEPTSPLQLRSLGHVTSVSGPGCVLSDFAKTG